MTPRDMGFQLPANDRERPLLEVELPHRPEITALADAQRREFPARQRLDADLSVAVFVRDEGDPPPVGRPAWIRLVPIAVGDREGIAAICGEHPEIVAPASLVGGEYQARAVGCDVGPCAPIGFLVVYLLRGGLRRIPVSVKTRSRPPEAAAAIGLSPCLMPESGTKILPACHL